MSATQQQETIEQQASPAPARTLAIASGKGGVGKSSIAVNLGVALARAGARTCILDVDTGLANVNILLGLVPRFSLEHVMFGGKPIRDIMLTGPHGLRVIPGANGISECVNLLPRQQRRLNAELADIERDFDYLLLDTAAGIADSTLDCICAAHRVLLVITPEPTSLTDAFSLVKLLHRRRPHDYQVIVNMCESSRQAREVYQRFGAAVRQYVGAETHLLGYLLRDESLRAAVTLQRPVTLFPESDPSCRAFVRLAEAVQGISAQPAPVGFAGFWNEQYRQRYSAAPSERRRSAPESAAESAPELPPDADDAAGTIEALRARLLAAMNTADASPEILAAAIQGLHDAFLQRFERPAVAAVPLVEWLAEHPERYAPVLRDLAGLLQSAADRRGQPATDDAAPRPPRAAVAAPPQRFDTGRFGSQSELVERLRQHRDDPRPLAELLDSL